MVKQWPPTYIQSKVSLTTVGITSVTFGKSLQTACHHLLRAAELFQSPKQCTHLSWVKNLNVFKKMVTAMQVGCRQQVLSFTDYAIALASFIVGMSSDCDWFSSMYLTDNWGFFHMDAPRIRGERCIDPARYDYQRVL